jgi:hypothetical protein
MKPVHIDKDKYSTIESPNLRNNYQMDLLDMSNYSKWNKGYKWLMNTIDVYSRYVYSIPLKSKDNDDVLSAFQTTIKVMGKPKNLNTDLESSVMSNQFQKYLNDNKIVHHKIDPSRKRNNGIIERYNRTIREKVVKYMESRDTKMWIDVIDKLTKNYNSSVHRTIREKPIDVWNKTDKPDSDRKEWSRDDLKNGDKVRILKTYNAFTKKSVSNDWTKQVYTVIGKDRKRFIVRNDNDHTDIKYKMGYEIQKLSGKIDEYQGKKDNHAKEFKEEMKTKKTIRRVNKEGIKPNFSNEKAQLRPTKRKLKPGEYEIEKIIDGKRGFWLIKWKGYDGDEATWESKKSIKNQLGEELNKQLIDAYNIMKK